MSDHLPVAVKLFEHGVRLRFQMSKAEIMLRLPYDSSYCEIALDDEDAIELGDLICRIIANRESELALERGRVIQHTPGEPSALNGQHCVRCGKRVAFAEPWCAVGVFVWDLAGVIVSEKPAGRVKKCKPLGPSSPR